MAIGDSAWRAECMYAISAVESSSNWACIEKVAMAGIGIMQWTYDRSWQLLNMLATDYPEVQSQMPILWDRIKPGTSSWGSKTFTDAEAKEISTVLATDAGKATQIKLWNQDLDTDYIPLLQQCSFTDVKSSIFALSVYHQAPNAFWQIYNACGVAGLDTWYRTTLNNGIVGKYTTRQNTVKSILDSWDGVTAPADFENTNIEDYDGGNYNPGNGNPDGAYSTTSTAYDYKYIEFYGKEITLHVSIGGSDKVVTFYKGSEGFYYPSLTASTIYGQTTDNIVPTSPTESPAPEGALASILAKMKSLEGTLQYSQASNLRTNIPGGYCDCSGLVWWLYTNYAGINVGTWTGDQCKNGVKIKEGYGSLSDDSGLQVGDLILIMWKGYNANFDHVEMYTGSNECMGHGGNPPVGPTVKNLATYTNSCYFWQVRRYIS